MDKSIVIKSGTQISMVFDQGTWFKHPMVRMIVDKTGEQRDPRGRVAFIAGKRLGNAVVRNRCKRLLREAARSCGLPVGGCDIVLMATPRTVNASATEVADAVRVLMKKASIDPEAD